VIAKSPGKGRSCQGLADAYSRKGDYASSIVQYNYCIEHNPLADVLYLQLAEIYRDHGNQDNEIETYRRALHAGIEGKKIHILLGDASFKQLHLAESLKEFKLAQTLDPENAYICYMIGMIYRAYEDYESSILYFQRALVLDPKEQHFRKQLAEVNFLKTSIRK
jgi:tetratricopeptide (TPR) repeat protein